MFFLLACALAYISLQMFRSYWSAYFFGLIFFICLKFVWDFATGLGIYNINALAITRYLTDSFAFYSLPFLLIRYVVLYKWRRKFDKEHDNNLKVVNHKNDFKNEYYLNEKVKVQEKEIEYFQNDASNKYNLNKKSQDKFPNLSNVLLERIEFEKKIDNDYEKETDWLMKQKLALLRLWMSYLNDYEFQYLDSNLDFEDYKKIFLLPSRFNTKNQKHISLSKKIVNAFENLINNEDFKLYVNCIYKPESLLSYPKEYIQKSVDFLIDNSTLFENDIKYLETIKMSLNVFINISKEKLPTDPIENRLIGIKLVNNRIVN